MSITISYPFGIIAHNKDAQTKICAHMNQMALAELDRNPDSMEVKITPINDNPLMLSALTGLLPLVAAFRSSYYPGLQTMVIEEAKAAEAAKNGNGRGVIKRTP